MQREKTYLVVAAAVLVVGTAVASYALTRLYQPCAPVDATPVVELPAEQPEQVVCPECGRPTYSDTLEDLPSLSAGWVYAINAGEDYLLAHPVGWKFVEESDNWEVSSYSLTSSGADIVMTVAGNSPGGLSKLSREDFETQKGRMVDRAIPIVENDETAFTLPVIPAYSGHADFEGQSYLVLAAEDRYFIVRAYSPTNSFESQKEIVEKIVRSLRSL